VTGDSAHRVAVVMVTYNSANVVGQSLTAVREGSAGVELVRVVVVDNGSQDDTIAVALSAFPGLEIVQMGENLGYAAAINRARLDGGDHDCVVILNPDTEVAPGCLLALARSLDTAGTGIAVPLLRGPGGAVSHSIRRAPSISTAAAEAVLGGRVAARLGVGEVVGDLESYGQESLVDWATGAALAMSRRCQDLIGAWDESFFLYSEETEVMLRASQHGFDTRFVPGAECYHRGGDSGVDPALWALQMVNKVALYRRAHAPASTVVFWAMTLAGQGVRAMSSSRRSRAALRELLHEGPLPRQRAARSRYLEMRSRPPRSGGTGRGLP
jgi:N-acetylglucosaminyl-diphospho-decaprenol L-rhamnosyltransferase